MRIGIRLGPLGGVKAGGASHSPPSARAPAGGGCGADRGRRARCAGGNEQPDKLVAIGMPSAAQLGREDEEALSAPVGGARVSACAFALTAASAAPFLAWALCAGALARVEGLTSVA
jgi:hypothetical protein